MLGYPKNEHVNFTSIHCAVESGDILEVERFLREGVDINDLNETKNTPLHIAALYGYLDIVAILCKRNADVNAVNELNYTALHYAACWGHVEIVKFLFSKGAKIDPLSKKNRTPLHLSAFAGTPQTIEFLLEAGANINAEDEKKETPLGIAVAQNQIEISKLLISKGANIEALNSENRTPLQIAVSRRNTEAAKLLLENKANVHIQDEIGNSPLHYSTLSKKNTEMLSVLLRAGADINMKNRSEQTSLHTAILYGDAENVDFLLENGANVNAKIENGTSALQVASYLGHTEIVKLLLKHKAMLNAKDGKGNTALHIAAIMGHEHITALLIQNGANSAARNKRGNTASYLAKIYKRSTVNMSNEKKPNSNLPTVSHDILRTQIYEAMMYLSFHIAKDCKKELGTFEIIEDNLLITATNIEAINFCTEFFAILFNSGSRSLKQMPLRFPISSVKKIIDSNLVSKYKESSSIVSGHRELFSFFPDFFHNCFLNSATQDKYVIYSYVMNKTRLNEAVQKFNQVLGAFGVIAFCKKTLFNLKFPREIFVSERLAELNKAINEIQWQAAATICITPVVSTSFRQTMRDEEEQAAELARRKNERQKEEDRKKELELQKRFTECRLKTQCEEDSLSDWSEIEEALPLLPTILDIPRSDVGFKISEPDSREGGIELIRDPIDDKGKGKEEEVPSEKKKEKKKPKRQKMSLVELEQFVSPSSSSSSSIVGDAPNVYINGFQQYRARGQNMNEPHFKPANQNQKRRN